MSEQKPREFWIRPEYVTPARTYEDIILTEPIPSSFLGEKIHVIEATPKTLAAEEMFEALIEREKEYLDKVKLRDQILQQDWYQGMASDVRDYERAMYAASLSRREVRALKKAKGE